MLVHRLLAPIEWGQLLGMWTPHRSNCSFEKEAHRPREARTPPLKQPLACGGGHGARVWHQ